MPLPGRRRPIASARPSLPLLGAPEAQRWCAKRSLALLAGCKSLPGKVSPTTRTACCVWGGGARTPNESYEAYPGNHGGHKGTRPSRKAGTASSGHGSRRRRLARTGSHHTSSVVARGWRVGRGPQGVAGRERSVEHVGDPGGSCAPYGGGKPSRPHGGRRKTSREADPLTVLRDQTGAGGRKGLTA